MKEESKLQDLEYLKSHNGLFTKKEEVDQFLKGDDSDIMKRDRLYKEVRYAKMTSQVLPSNAEVFRLRTKGSKYLTPQEYASNLSKYLDDSRSVTKVTIGDLHQILLDVESKSGEKEGSKQQEQDNEVEANSSGIKKTKRKKEHPHKTQVTPQEDVFVAGQHIVVYWDEGADVRKWYLGVIDEVNNNRDIFVSHFIRANRYDDTTWTFPESKDLQPVHREQILIARVDVSYPLSVRHIRCIMSQQDVATVKQLMDDIQ